MGCAASRLHDNPAVALCRHRCYFIDDALRHSHALADAHLACSRSLTAIAPTLLRFFAQISPEPPTSEPSPPPRLSSSGSHIRFTSDLEDGDGGRDTESYAKCMFPAQPVYGSSSPPRFGGGGSPPPPPAPASSAWDFLNFFETFERIEHIPRGEFKDEPIRGAENKLGQNEKKIEAKSTEISAPSKFQIDVSRVMGEVQIQFEKAAKSGDEVMELLDAGRFRYQSKNSVYQEVSSESMESTKESAEKIGSVLWGLDKDEDKAVARSGNLCAALKQMCMWEKKLYDEVKAEEKLCMIHEKKSRQLKHLNAKGAEAAHKVDKIRTLVRALCTKRKIAFQMVDNLSVTICNLRDDELWPCITKLIQGLSGMWKSMLECHMCQHQVVAEAKFLDTIASDGKLNDACLEVTMQLRFQIRSWILNFSTWIDAQRCFVKALNSWLMKCLLYEPEENADGKAVPFSPSRIGAPRVFVICDEWSQAMDRLSENEVIEAMEGLFTSVNQLIERYNKELQERVVVDKDMERKLKVLEREEQKMQKILRAREKKTMLLTGEKKGAPFSNVHHSQVSSTNNLHLSLKQSFNAMESFAAKSVQAYDELLCACFKEEEHAKENPKAP